MEQSSRRRVEPLESSRSTRVRGASLSPVDAVASGGVASLTGQIRSIDRNRKCLQCRILRLNQRDLLFPAPPLELFFPFDGLCGGGVPFKIHEIGDIVSLGEGARLPLSMLAEAPT